MWKEYLSIYLSSLTSCIVILSYLMYKSFTSLVIFIFKHFIIFVAIVRGIIFLIFLLDGCLYIENHCFLFIDLVFSSVQFSSVAQSCPTLQPHESQHALQKNPRADILQNGLVGCPCSPRDSQESSPTPQFKSLNSSVLSFLHSPTLTSIHDHRKNHSLD